MPTTAREPTSRRSRRGTTPPRTATRSWCGPVRSGRRSCGSRWLSRSWARRARRHRHDTGRHPAWSCLQALLLRPGPQGLQGVHPRRGLQARRGPCVEGPELLLGHRGEVRCGVTRQPLGERRHGQQHPAVRFRLHWWPEPEWTPCLGGRGEHHVRVELSFRGREWHPCWRVLGLLLRPARKRWRRPARFRKSRTAWLRVRRGPGGCRRMALSGRDGWQGPGPGARQHPRRATGSAQPGRGVADPRGSEARHRLDRRERGFRLRGVQLADRGPGRCRDVWERSSPT